MVKGGGVAGRSFQLLSHEECQSNAAAMEISDDNWVEVSTRKGAWSSVEVEVAMERTATSGVRRASWGAWSRGWRGG